MEALDNLTLILILILKKEQWNNCHMTKRTNHPRPRRASLFLSSKLGLNLHQFLHHHRHQNLFRASLSNNGERQTAVGRQSRIKVKIRINLKIGNFKHFLRRISFFFVFVFNSPPNQVTRFETFTRRSEKGAFFVFFSLTVSAKYYTDTSGDVDTLCCADISEKGGCIALPTSGALKDALSCIDNVKAF